jgi:2-aminoethylphosphonate-pyruvate transaminase
VIVTVHQPSDPRFDLHAFVEALKRRGVLISNFYNTAAPTLRIGAIGAITTDDIHRAVAAIAATLDEALAQAA